MLCVSVALSSFPLVRTYACDCAGVFASVGVHPNENTEPEPQPEELIALSQDPKVIAIGETGLDYFRSGGELKWQRERFRRHIAAAKATDKPLIVHCREAAKDTIQILTEEGADEVGGVMHCFVEDWETAKQAMDLNFYVSFSGIVTFKNALAVKEVATKLPLDRMLVETDSPYLAPVPYRGKVNQPAYVRFVAEHIAELRGTTLAAIAEATTENFFTLFKDASPVSG